MVGGGRLDRRLTLKMVGGGRLHRRLTLKMVGGGSLGKRLGDGKLAPKTGG